MGLFSAAVEWLMVPNYLVEKEAKTVENNYKDRRGIVLVIRSAC